MCFFSDWYFVFLKKVLSTFSRSEKIKILYSCVQHFEFIRSKKGCKLNIQKHEILLKICMRPWIRRYLFWRKLVITRRSWQLQSSYFACADLWTCWIRCWYSRSPKLTKMTCFWPFSFLYFFIFFISFQFLGRRHEALAFKCSFLYFSFFFHVFVF